MKISSINICNYRIYKGENIVSFNIDSQKNIFIISGDNGFGKTTFLTSLIWCLYGPQMMEVDIKFKKEFFESGGYKRYLTSCLNKSCLKQLEELQLSADKIKEIKKNGYDDYSPYDKHIQSLSTYFVSMILNNIYIPSVPCKTIEISRSYDVIREKENVNILIDGVKNELTREVGPDIFINDFILSKDIAKFFFFDSEKIVSLAEIQSLSDKKELSQSFSQVLGVKKYEDLKNSLENLRIRLRRKSSDIGDRNKLITAVNRQNTITKIIDDNDQEIKILDDKITNLKTQSDEIQIRLIREGSNITIEELNIQKEILDNAKKKDIEYKETIKSFLEIAPFAIAAKKFRDTCIQANNELENRRSASLDLLKKEMLDTISSDLVNIFSEKLNIPKNKIIPIIQRTFNDYISTSGVASPLPILNLNETEISNINSIYRNITTNFQSEFKKITDEYKRNKQIIDRSTRIISNVESKENDLLVKKIRINKNDIDKNISDTSNSIRNLIEANGKLQNELIITKKTISELTKRVSLDNNDRQKDIIAERLIIELNTFLLKLRTEKKESIAERIKTELNLLMHKEDLISNVVVNIDGDLIDILLFDPDGIEIKKDTLSKGEQQLYATSILKSMVDESGISFPIFIDSPMQKFDKIHSTNIIREFYPNLSEQVILFPLLGKELTRQEYDELKKYIRNVFVIVNKDGHSHIEKKDIDALFNTI